MDYPIVSFIGKFHPLLVHLPIGMLIVGILFGILGTRESYAYLRRANGLVLLLTALSATFSCLTGWLLSRSGGYPTSAVQWHQWMGIGLAAISWYLFLIHQRDTQLYKAALVVAALLLVATGHLGGSITHGEDFLAPPPVSQWFGNQGIVEPKFIADSTVAYDAVARILAGKCGSCHGAGGKKGELRLDAPAHIQAGGEHGSVLTAGVPDKSRMIEYILLPTDDEDHMPPKEKSQLSAGELAVLVQWVKAGADFGTTVSEQHWPDSILEKYNTEVAAYLKKDDFAYVPKEKVKAASASVLTAADTAGLTILPISTESNYLMVSLRGLTMAKLPAALEQLGRLKEQCIRLEISGLPLDEQGMKAVSEMYNLRKLTLMHCSLSDAQVSLLAKLGHLEYLNLVGNPLSASGLSVLGGLSKLRQLYLYQTKASSADLLPLRSAFPHALIDFGGYTVPLLESDTATIVY